MHMRISKSCKKPPDTSIQAFDALLCPHDEQSHTHTTRHTTPTGGFFSSDRMDTETFRNQTLYYRGKFIQEAIFRDLKENRCVRAVDVI